MRSPCALPVRQTFQAFFAGFLACFTGFLADCFLADCFLVTRGVEDLALVFFAGFLAVFFVERFFAGFLADCFLVTPRRRRPGTRFLCWLLGCLFRRTLFLTDVLLFLLWCLPFPEVHQSVISFLP